MSSEYFPAYSTARNEIVSVNVTQEKLKNLTKVGTSNFALKTKAAEIKNKVDKVDVDKNLVKKMNALK